MNTVRYATLGLLFGLAAAFAWAQAGRAAAIPAEAPLPSRVAHLEAVAPGQGELMSVLGYHFGNLWFALDKGNWPLADFYLKECRESLIRAVDAAPTHKLSSGNTIALKGVAEALDRTQLADLKKAIGAKAKDQAVSAYRDAMRVCVSCHMMCEKPFLRLRIPAAPPASIIVFDAADVPSP